jgi:hypothetical protein
MDGWMDGYRDRTPFLSRSARPSWEKRPPDEAKINTRLRKVGRIRLQNGRNIRGASGPYKLRSNIIGESTSKERLRALLVSPH